MAMSSTSRTFTVSKKFNDSVMWNIENRCLQGSQNIDFHLLFLTGQMSPSEYVFEFSATIKYSGCVKDVRIFKKSFYEKAVIFKETVS